MTEALEQLAAPPGGADGEQLFAAIAGDLLSQGYSINPQALPPELTADLLQQLHRISTVRFTPAGTGREHKQALDSLVRNDKICWITGESAAGRRWLDWAGQLQTYLNRRLLLGLFSFESHFAHYPRAAHYRRHFDAFRGDCNRILSVVAYLNREWLPDDGGELVIYPDGDDPCGITVSPVIGTLVVYLSEDFEHEVLPARRDRFSIAGWFSVNSSRAWRVNPPV